MKKTWSCVDPANVAVRHSKEGKLGTGSTLTRISAWYNLANQNSQILGEWLD